MRSFAAHGHAPSASRTLGAPVPLFVLEDGLTAAERERVCALYEPTLLLPLPASVPRGFPLDRGSKWASNLRKLFALFQIGNASCQSIVKIDTGDMLVLRDPSALFALATAGTGRVLMAQALIYERNLNGGLAIFQRNTLTDEALEALLSVGKGRDNYREQWLLRKWLT